MAETINLVGQFSDGITPKLKKLNAELTRVGKSFGKMGRAATTATRKLNTPLKKVSSRLKDQSKATDRATKSWKAYTAAVTRASRAQNRFRTRSPGRAPMASNGGQMGGARGVGVGGLAAATFIGGAALRLAETGLRSLAQAANRFVASGVAAQNQLTMASNTISVLGNMDFASAEKEAQQVIENLTIAARTSPATADRMIGLFGMVIDDMAQGFGSMQDALEDANKGVDGFVGMLSIFGNSLSAPVLAGDISQLAANPNANMRQITLFRENKALFEKYKANLVKFNGDWFKSLYTAMQESMSPELIDKFRTNLGTALNEFGDRLFGTYGGLFGAMRRVKVTLSSGVTEIVNTMDTLGFVFRSLNNIVMTLLGPLMGSASDPLVMINQFLLELDYQFFKANAYLKAFFKGNLSLSELEDGFYEFVAKIFQRLTKFILDLNYSQFFYHVDRFIGSLFQGIIDGIRDKLTNLKLSDFKELKFSISGVIVALGLFTIALGKATLMLGLQSGPRIRPGGKPGPRVTQSGGRRPGVLPGGKPRVTTSGGGKAGRGFFQGMLNQTDDAIKGAAFLAPLRRAGAQFADDFGRMLLPITKGLKPFVKGSKNFIKGSKNFVKGIPGLNVAIAALDFGLRVSQGESAGRAASGAGGALLGGIAGGALLSALGPVGIAIGGIAGSFIGDWLGTTLYDLFTGEIDLSKAAGAVGNFFTTTVPDLYMQGLDRMKETFTTTIPNLFSRALEELDKTLVERIPSALGSLAGHIQGWVIYDLPKAWEGFQTWASGVGTDISTFATEVKTNFGTFITDIGSKAADLKVNFDKSVTAFLDFIKDSDSWGTKISGALAKVTSAITTWANGIGGKVQGALSWLRQKGGEIGENFNSNMEESRESHNPANKLKLEKVSFTPPDVVVEPVINLPTPQVAVQPAITLPTPITNVEAPQVAVEPATVIPPAVNVAVAASKVIEPPAPAPTQTPPKLIAAMEDMRFTPPPAPESSEVVSLLAQLKSQIEKSSFATQAVMSDAKPVAPKPDLQLANLRIQSPLAPQNTESTDLKNRYLMDKMTMASAPMSQYITSPAPVSNATTTINNTPSITIQVDGTEMNRKEMAEAVSEELVLALQRANYGEVFTS